MVLKMHEMFAFVGRWSTIQIELVSIRRKKPQVNQKQKEGKRKGEGLRKSVISGSAAGEEAEGAKRAPKGQGDGK
jgi:hypothetical protein